MKKTSVRSGLAWILILVMLLSAVPFGVFAEGAAPQEGTGETPVISVNAGEEKCLCKDRAKCTQEDFNKDCPVCSAKDADLDKCCEGKTPEQLTADAEAKKAAEEEAAKKAAEEEAAKKTAEEEAAKKTAEEEAAKKAAEEEAAKKAAEEEAAKKAAEEEAAKKAAEEEAAKKAAEEEAAKKAAEEAQEASEKAVRNVQEKINALPAADTITAENRGAVEEALTAIDDAKEELTDEEREKLDFTRYDAAVNALYALDGMPGAGVPATLEENSITFTYKEATRPDGIPKTIGELMCGWQTAQFDGKWLENNPNVSLPYGTNYVLRGVWSSIETGIEAANTYLLTLTWGKEKGEQFTQIKEDALDCNPIKALAETTDFSLKVQGLVKLATRDNNTMVKVEVNGDSLSFHGTASLELKVYVVVYPPATVTFHANAGGANKVTLPDNITSFKTGTVDLSEQKATRPGYIFKGWSTSEGADAADVTSSIIMQADNVDLYAVWEQVDIKLTGDGVTEQTVHPNSEGMLDKQWFELTKAGYVFRGWKDVDGNIVREDKVYEQNTTLTAFWVNMKTDGNVFPVLPLTKAHGDILLGNSYNDFDTVDIVTGSASESKLSYLAQKGREKLNAKDSRGVFYFSIEVWKYSGVRTQVSDTGKTMWFDLTNFWKDFGGQMVIVREHKVTGQQTEIQYITQKDPAALEDGVTEGWCWKDGRLYLVARYFSNFAMVAARPVVSFDSQGGTTCTDAQVGIGGTLDSLPTSTRTGYTFDGWYLTKDCTGTKLDTSHVYHADTTVYAKWNPWNYTVIFDGNGGKVKNSVKTSETVSAVYGSEVTVPEFVKEYYTVSGWARNADGTEKVKSPIKDLAASNGERITLYAQWEYAPRTVTFDANGVDNNGKATKGTVTEDGTEKPSVTRKTQESPINTLKTVPVPNAQEGYYFEGWYYKDRTGKEQPVEIGKTEFTADTTVYAKWKVFEPVTVTLKCQRGTMTVDGKSVSQGTMQTKWPGVLDGTLPTPARTGYKFQGWYTYAGVKVDENTVFLRDTTIYARWVSAVSRTGNPKTGDQIALEAAVAVLVVAAVGLGAAVLIKKKQHKQ